MTVVRLDTEEALFKDLSQKPLGGVCEETGIPHIRSGYWLRQSKRKESSRHSPYYVFCTDNIEPDKPQGQQQQQKKHNVQLCSGSNVPSKLYVENSMPKTAVLGMGPS